MKGYDLDWMLLHQGESTLKLSLPTYPFKKERHWIPTSDTATSFTIPTAMEMIEALHPLITRNVSTLDEQRFQTRLTKDQFYLKDYVGV